MLAKNDRELAPMSSAAVTRMAATSLMRRTEARTGSRMLAYQIIAGKIGRSSAWVRALISQGMERVDGDIGWAIDALLIQEIEAEIARLNAEMEMARQRGYHPASKHVCEIETYLGKARALLNGRPA